MASIRTHMPAPHDACMYRRAPKNTLLYMLLSPMLLSPFNTTPDVVIYKVNFALEKTLKALTIPNAGVKEKRTVFSEHMNTKCEYIITNLMIYSREQKWVLTPCHLTCQCDGSRCFVHAYAMSSGVTRRKQHRPGIAPNANTTHVPTAGSSAAPTKPNHTPTPHPRAKGKPLLQTVTPHAA